MYEERWPWLDFTGLAFAASPIRVDPEKLESTAEAAYAFARTYYRVGLEVSEPLQKPRQLTLRSVESAKKKHEALAIKLPSLAAAPMKQ
jgi:hypothetical protein